MGKARLKKPERTPVRNMSSPVPITGSIPLSNVRYEAFVLARSKGLSQKAAASVAGYSKATASQTGSRLETKVPAVKERLAFLKGQVDVMDMTLEQARQEMIEMGGPDLVDGITAKWLCLEFFKNAVEARAHRQYKEANHALVYIAKLNKKMPSDIPFPPGSPHPIEHAEISVSRALTHGEDNATETRAIQGSFEDPAGVGDSPESEPETTEAFEFVSPNDIGEDDEDGGRGTPA